MTNPDASETRLTAGWNRALPVFFNYLIVTVMMTCATSTLVAVVQALSPGWNGTYIVVISSIVALDALYTSRLIRHIHFPSREWISYRVGEVVAILVVLKALIYLMRDASKFLTDLQLWQQDFLVQFFTGEYLLACVVVLFVYLLSSQFSADLLELEADDATLERELQNDFRNDRAAVRKQLTLKIVLLAAAMIIVSMLGRGYLRLNNAEDAANRISVGTLLIYVILGLLLLSLTRFTALRAMWYREKAVISPAISRRWPFFAIGFLIIVGFIVSVLPTHYTIGLLQMLNIGLGALVTILHYLLFIILFILAIPLNLLMQLLGKGAVTPSTPPPAQIMPALPAGEPSAGNPLFDMIQSFLFWAIFLFVVGYALVNYIRRHGRLVNILRNLPIIGWLAAGISALGQLLRMLSKQLIIAVDAGLMRLRSTTNYEGANILSTRRWTSLRRMSPRERVQYFYLAMVRRAGERGWTRRPAQTPREYAATLDSAAPEVNAEIDSLTDAFVEARYSRHDITPDRAHTVQSWWERVRGAIRKRK